jgi:hypothetical protein
MKDFKKILAIGISQWEICLKKKSKNITFFGGGARHPLSGPEHRHSRVF